MRNKSSVFLAAEPACSQPSRKITALPVSLVDLPPFVVRGIEQMRRTCSYTASTSVSVWSWLSSSDRILKSALFSPMDFKAIMPACLIWFAVVPSSNWQFTATAMDWINCSTPSI